MKKPSTPWSALLLALFAIVVWGMSFAVTRATVREIPPMTLAFVRFLLAGAALWPVAYQVFRKVKIQPSDRWGVFGLGIFGVSLYFAFENYSLKYTTASHGALIIATIPLATELAHAWAVRRRPSLTVLAGSLVALLGVVLLLGPADGEASLLGDLLMFGAVGCWVGYTFLADRLVRRYPNLLLTLLIMLIGAATLLPFALLEAAFGMVTRPSAGAWSGIVFLGVLCSAVAYLFWNRALPELGIPATNALLYGIPLVGVLTGIIALDEPLTAGILLGLILIPGGVFLAGYKSFRKSPKSQVPSPKSQPEDNNRQ